MSIQYIQQKLENEVLKDKVHSFPMVPVSFKDFVTCTLYFCLICGKILLFYNFSYFLCIYDFLFMCIYLFCMAQYALVLSNEMNLRIEKILQGLKYRNF